MARLFHARTAGIECLRSVGFSFNPRGMRPRPMWRAPKKRYPKGAGPGVHEAMRAKRTAFSDFSPGSGRRQCRAVARSTGEQCRRDAVQGATRCRVHKGISDALASAKRLDPKVRRSANGGAARRALVAIAFQGPPEGVIDTGEGITALGRRIEAFRNRELDPETLSTLSKCQMKSKT